MPRPLSAKTNAAPKSSEKSSDNERRNPRRRLKVLGRKIRPVTEREGEHPRVTALRSAFWG